MADPTPPPLPQRDTMLRIFGYLDRMDRRIVYAVVFLTLLVPILAGIALKPSDLATARNAYAVIDALKPADDKIVLVAMDWTAGTKAENEPQTAVIIEHLLKKRIKFALINVIDPQSRPFLKKLPKQIVDELQKKNPGEKWEYGKDWVNLGYKPGFTILIQQIAKATDLKDLFKTDAEGKSLREVPCMKNIKSIADIPVLVEVTGSVGALGAWVAFFQTKDSRPSIVHGCTSISISDTFIYLDSGQIAGLLEGVAGAARYSEDLGYSRTNPSVAMLNMTSISMAHVMIILFIVIGNIGMLVKKYKTPKES